ncbi:hypothetical protein Ahy_A08g038157 [Arachis hypogaea]|uniref:Uncharacterized protein n=1 Tax=Arachis hypogaea TaxID=3818 RepID=A0A445BSQ5_ARAHY|nr:hypothetical protein Ahy_A08g038157 [Arachis hypogaea]
MRSGIKFTNKDPLSIFLKPSTSFIEILISMLSDGVKYNSFVIDNDKDLQVLFHCGHQFFKIRTHELLTKLVDVVYSSTGSNPNPQYSTMPTISSSMPLGALSSMPVIAPEVVFVASLSLSAYLYFVVEKRDSYYSPDFRGEGSTEWCRRCTPTTIVDDNDDDITMSIPARVGGASSSADSNASLASLCHLHSR